MSGYFVTPSADADLDEVWNYVALHSGAAAADRLEGALHAAMRRLAEMPGMGHARADLTDEPVRFFRVYSYLIVYRPETTPLQVVRVLHGARDVRAVLGADPTA